MSTSTPKQSRRVYKIECDDGRRYIVYNASEIGNPPDHLPDKWYVLPYPSRIGLEAGEPFDTAEEAERAARTRSAGFGEDSILN